MQISDTFSWALNVHSIISAASQKLGVIKIILFDASKKIQGVAYVALCTTLLE